MKGGGCKGRLTKGFSPRNAGKVDGGRKGHKARRTVFPEKARKTECRKRAERTQGGAGHAQSGIATPPPTGGWAETRRGRDI